MKSTIVGVLASSLVFLLPGCGGGGGGGTSATTYTIGGNISGLSGSVVLQNNGADDLTVSSDGPFTFNTAVSSGGAYAVTVLTQPGGQTCTVSNGSGTASANINTVTVQCGPWTGTKQLGAAGATTQGYSVATDASGNVYVVGTTDGGLDGSTLTGTKDAFLTKYDSNGAKQYTRQLGVTWAETHGRSVATDADDNVYVAGYTYGGLDGNTLTGYSDFFVTKYNSSGVKQYTRQLGVAGSYTIAIGESVATDASGNIYVTGYTNGGLDGNMMMGTHDFFLTKYDSSGTKQYTRQLGATGVSASTFGKSVATDASGNIYVAGYTNMGMDGNTGIGTYYDFFVTKYDSNGVKQYTRQLGAAGAETFGYSVATDASGNFYVTGYTNGGLDGNTLTGILDFFVTKYDSTGIRQYTRQLGATGAVIQGNSVATDASGNVYVAGYTTGGLDGNTLTGDYDFFVTKYNSSGVRQYTRQLGAAGAGANGTSVATDASSNVFVAGITSGGLDGNTLTGNTDFFVTKFSSDGVKQ